MSRYELIYNFLQQKELLLQRSRLMYDGLLNTIRMCTQGADEITTEEISVDARLLEESLSRLSRLRSESEAMDLLIAGRPRLAEQDLLAQKCQRRVRDWLREISMVEVIDSPKLVSDVTLDGFSRAFSAFESAETQFNSLARSVLLAETSTTTEMS